MSATLGIDGSAAGAIKAVDDLNKKLDETEKKSDKAAAASKRMAEEAKRVAASVDPQEKYNQKTERYKQLVDANVLSVEHFEKATAKARLELDKAGQSNEKAFGDTALGKVAAIAGGYFSVQAAVSAVTAALSEMEQRAQASADSVLTALGSAGELQQLGPESFSRGAATARKLQRLGVVSSLSQGFDIATNLENAGFDAGEQNFLIDKVAKGRIVKAENLESVGGAIKKFQTAFGADAGSLPEVFDKALTAAGVTQANVTQTLNETLKFASLFAKLGFTDEESLGAFAGVEVVSPSSENAAEQLKSFGAQVFKRGLGKGNLSDTLANITSKIKGDTTAFDVLGEQNAVIGYQNLIQQQGFIREQIAGIGGSRGALDARLGLLDTDAALAAANARASAEGALQEEIGRRSPAENLLDAVRADRLRASGGSWVASLVNKIKFGAMDALGQEDFALREVALSERSARQSNIPGRVSDETLKQVERHLSEINGAQKSKKSVRQE